MERFGIWIFGLEIVKSAKTLKSEKICNLKHSDGNHFGKGKTVLVRVDRSDPGRTQPAVWGSEFGLGRREQRKPDPPNIYAVLRRAG